MVLGRSSAQWFNWSTSIGLLQPEVLQDMLRGLKPGELSAPRQLGDWHVLLRLEQLQPARFDDAMRSQMEMEQLNTFLEDRTNQVLAAKLTALRPFITIRVMKEQPLFRLKGCFVASLHSRMLK